MNKPDQYKLGKTVWEHCYNVNDKRVFIWQDTLLYENELIQMGAVEDKPTYKTNNPSTTNFKVETEEPNKLHENVNIEENEEFEEIKELEQIKMTASDFHGLAKIFEFWISEAGSRVNKLIYNQNKLTRIVKQLKKETGI